MVVGNLYFNLTITFENLENKLYFLKQIVLNMPMYLGNLKKH